MRRLLNPGFTEHALKSQESIVQRYVELLMQRLREHAEVSGTGTEEGAMLDIAPWFNYTTFDIFGDLGFGESFKCLEHSRYHPWIALVFNSVKAASFVISARFYPLIDWLLMKCIPDSISKM
jgi:cytochrome P450